MKTLASVLGLAAFLLNPNWACSGVDAEENKYQFGATEMKAAVEGTWEAKLSHAGTTAEFRFQLTQAATSTALRSISPGVSPTLSWIRSAHACGNRTFIASASACLDVSTMPLSASYVSGNTQLGEKTLWATEAELTPAKADFSVISLKMAPGHLYIWLGDFRIEATVAPDGTVTDARASFGEPSESAELQLERLK